MPARIYQPAKTAVSSGRFKTQSWLLEFEPRTREEADRLIGWLGSDDTQQQLRMHFPTKEAAIAFCEKRGVDYSVALPHERIVRPKAYADNFIRRV